MRFMRYLFILAITLVSFSSCYIDINEPVYDGRPGDAYIELEWDYSPPDYLDAGTSDIPTHFEYGRYYLTRPGWYNLYYEGEFWDGYDLAYYAWELDYEIWRNPGTYGHSGHDGVDGLDSYLTIVLSPYGPYTYRLNKSTGASLYKIIEERDNVIVVEQTSEEFTIRITYRKVDKRS